MHHALTGRDYKKAYGLTFNTALVGESTRARIIEGRKMWNKGQLREGLVKYDQDVQSGKIKHDGNKARNGGWPLERRNLERMCPRPDVAGH